MSLPKNIDEEVMACSIEVTEFMKYWHFDKYLESEQKGPFVSAEIMRKCVNEYWHDFEKHCFKVEFKPLFKKYFHEVIMWVFVNELNLPPLSQQFDDYKALLKEMRTDVFWNKDKADALFITESNKEFFNYVMRYFKEDVELYKKTVYSFMFWRMRKVFYGKSSLYKQYINDNVNDFTLYEKVLALKVISKGYDKLAQRNRLFDKAQENWNKENPVFNKQFDTIDIG